MQRPTKYRVISPKGTRRISRKFTVKLPTKYPYNRSERPWTYWEYLLQYARHFTWIIDVKRPKIWRKFTQSRQTNCRCVTSQQAGHNIELSDRETPDVISSKIPWSAWYNIKKVTLKCPTNLQDNSLRDVRKKSPEYPSNTPDNISSCSPWGTKNVSRKLDVRWAI